MSIEQETLDLKSSVAKCEENRRSQIEISQKEKEQLQGLLQKRLQELHVTNSLMSKASEELNMVRNQYEKLKTNFAADTEKDAREIQRLNDTIGSQKKILDQVDQFKREIETKNTELAEMKKDFALTMANQELMLKQENDTRNQLKMELENDFQNEREQIISSHTSVLSEKQSLIARLSADLDGANGMIHDNQDQMGGLKQELLICSEKLSELQREWAADNNQQRSDSIELKQQLDNMRTQSALLQSNLDKLMEENVGNMNQKYKLEDVITREREQSSNMLKELRDALISQKENSILEMRQQESEHVKVVSKLENDKMSLETTYNMEITTYKNKITALEKERDNNAALLSKESMKTQEKINMAVAQFEKNLSRRSEELDKVRDQVNKLEQERETLNNQFSKCDSDLREIRVQYDQCNANSEAMVMRHEKEIKNLQNRLDLANQIARDHQNNLSESEKKFFELASKCDSNERDLVSTSNELSSCQANMSNCTAQINELTEKIDTLHESLSKSESSKQSLQLELETYVRDFGTTQKLLDGIKKEVSSARSNMAELLNQVAIQDDQIKQLTNELQNERFVNERKEVVNNALKTNIEDLLNRNRECIDKTNDCYQRTATLKRFEKEQVNNIENLSNQINELNSTIEKEGLKYNEQLEKHQLHYNEQLDLQQKAHENELQRRKKDYDAYVLSNTSHTSKIENRQNEFVKQVNEKLTSITDAFSDLKSSVMKLQADSEDVDEYLDDYEMRQHTLQSSIDSLKRDMVSSYDDLL